MTATGARPVQRLPRLVLPSSLEVSLERNRQWRRRTQMAHSDLVVIREELGEPSSTGDDLARLVFEFRDRLDAPTTRLAAVSPYPLAHVDDDAYANDRREPGYRSVTAHDAVMSEIGCDTAELVHTIDSVRRHADGLLLNAWWARDDDSVALLRRRLRYEVDRFGRVFMKGVAAAHMVYRAEQSLLLREGRVVGRLDRELAPLLLYADPRWRSLQPGEILVNEGDPSDDVFVLAQGTIGVEAGGRRVGYHVSEAVLGEMAAVAPGGRRAATLRALTSARVAIVDAKHVDRSILGKRARIRTRDPARSSLLLDF